MKKIKISLEIGVGYTIKTWPGADGERVQGFKSKLEAMKYYMTWHNKLYEDYWLIECRKSYNDFHILDIKAGSPSCYHLMTEKSLVFEDAISKIVELRGCE